MFQEVFPGLFGKYEFGHYVQILKAKPKPHSQNAQPSFIADSFHLVWIFPPTGLTAWAQLWFHPHGYSVAKPLEMETHIQP